MTRGSRARQEPFDGKPKLGRERTKCVLRHSLRRGSAERDRPSWSRRNDGDQAAFHPTRSADPLASSSAADDHASEACALACCRYIELDPVRVRMVRHPRAYRWSSYRVPCAGRDRSAADRPRAVRPTFTEAESCLACHASLDGIGAGAPCDAACWIGRQSRAYAGLERVTLLDRHRFQRGAYASGNRARRPVFLE
jgi:hypothetical protein